MNKHRTQIEDLLMTIDNLKRRNSLLKEENADLKRGVNSIIDYLSGEQAKLLSTVRQKIQTYQNETE